MESSSTTCDHWKWGLYLLLPKQYGHHQHKHLKSKICFLLSDFGPCMCPCMHVCVYQKVVAWLKWIMKWIFVEFSLVVPFYEGFIHMSTNLANVVGLTSNFHSKKIYDSWVHIHTLGIHEVRLFYFATWLKFEALVVPLRKNGQSSPAQSEGESGWEVGSKGLNLSNNYDIANSGLVLGFFLKKSHVPKLHGLQIFYWVECQFQWKDSLCGRWGRFGITLWEPFAIL